MAERPEDLNLPNAVITRIIKESIPEGVNISKEARLAISKAASVFILYATSCSNNFAMKAKRKTINALDVIAAMEEMEFEEFADPLRLCLDAFRKEKQDKKNDSQKKKKAKEEANLSSESIQKEEAITNPAAHSEDEEDGEEIDEGIEDEQEGIEEELEEQEGIEEEEEMAEMPALDNSDEEDSVEEISDS